MLSPQQSRRAQRTIIIFTLGLFLYTFLVFQPLAKKADAADKPLRAAWDKLSKTHVGGSSDKLDLNEIDQQLQKAKSVVSALERAQQRVFSSVSSDSTGRLKGREPFQLVDFQIEKLLQIEEIGRAAQSNNVAIATTVFSSFPEYRADRGLPELLWGQLVFVDQLLATAVRCKVSTIESLDLPPYTAHSRGSNDAPFLYEIPMRLEVKGSMESISKFLASLPLRAPEVTAANLPEAPPDKPGLYIHRFILIKSSPENPEEAHLDLRACGFVYRE
jgi:hypothetical protein